MSFTMQITGYLNQKNNLRNGARTAFFTHRDEFLQQKNSLNSVGITGLPEEPFSDEEKELVEFIPQGEDAASSENYPTYHLNWISGILTECLRYLNRQSNIHKSIHVLDGENPQKPQDGPYFDIAALADSIKSSPAATPAIKGLVTAGDVKGQQGTTFWLKNPPIGNVAMASTFFNTIGDQPSGVKAEFEALVNNIIPKSWDFVLDPVGKFTYPKGAAKADPEAIAAPTENEENCLTGKQRIIITAVDAALKATIKEILKHEATSPKSFIKGIELNDAKSMTGLYEIAATQIRKEFSTIRTKLKDADGLSGLANIVALERLLVKAMTLTALGILVGASPDGTLPLLAQLGHDVTRPEAKDDIKPIELVSPQEEQPTSGTDSGISKLLTDISMAAAGDPNQERKDVDQFKFSIHGLEWLLTKEGGIQKKVYDDGIGILTVGLGFALATGGKPTTYRKGDDFSPSKLYTMLVNYLWNANNMVRRNLKKWEEGPIATAAAASNKFPRDKISNRLAFTQYEYDTFFYWVWGFGHVPTKLLNAMVTPKKPFQEGRKSPYPMVSDEIVTWIMGTGNKKEKDKDNKEVDVKTTVEIPGMKKRRQMEGIFWETGDYNAYRYYYTTDSVYSAAMRGGSYGSPPMIEKLSDTDKYDADMYGTVLPLYYPLENAMDEQVKKQQIASKNPPLGITLSSAWYNTAGHDAQQGKAIASSIRESEYQGDNAPTPADEKPPEGTA